METWRLDEEEHFRNMGKEKKTVNYGPMGPNHPGWESMLQETEDMLKHAGRIYDQATIKAIALDEVEWTRLSKEANKNIMDRAKDARFSALGETIGRIRNDAKSQQRLNNLFGGNVKTGF